MLLKALDAEPGSMVGLSEPPGAGPRLQDLVSQQPLEVTVHDGFDYWVADLDDSDGSMAAALQQANEAAAPTQALAGVEGGVLDLGRQPGVPPLGPPPRRGQGPRRLRAPARRRCRAPGGRDRLIGMFRAHGLVVPVWDLPLGTGAAALAKPSRGWPTASPRRWPRLLR